MNKIQTYSGKENASTTCIVIIITMQKIKKFNNQWNVSQKCLHIKTKGVNTKFLRRKVTNSTNFNDNLIKLVSSQLHVY